MQNTTRLCTISRILIILLCVGCTKGFQPKLTNFSSSTGSNGTGGSNPGGGGGNDPLPGGGNSLPPSCSAFQGAKNLKYFGYYCSSCEWVGKGDYTSEVKDISNLIWIASGDISHVVAQLENAKSLGLYAVVSGLNIGALVDLQTDIWNTQIVPKLKPYVDAGVLVSIYVADDNFSANIMSEIAMIKTAFPTVATSAILASLPTSVPAGLDWIGLEMYSGVVPDWHPKLKAMLSANQRILLVPSAWAGSYIPGVDASADVPTLIDGILNLAQQDETVIGVIPFLWQSDWRSTGGAGLMTGARDIPAIRTRLVSASSCITGKPIPDGESLALSHPILGKLLGMESDAGGKFISGWACAKDSREPVTVTLFTRGPAGTGEYFVGNYSNQISPDPDANTLCGNDAPHGFKVYMNVLPGNEIGQKVYAQAYNFFDWSGHSDRTLDGSGSLVLESYGIIGAVDGIVDTPNGKAISGWACLNGSDTAIGVLVSNQSTAAGGASLAFGFADKAGDSKISADCGSNSSSHRFLISIDFLLPQYDGQPLYVYGQSPTNTLRSRLISDPTVDTF